MDSNKVKLNKYANRWLYDMGKNAYATLNQVTIYWENFFKKYLELRKDIAIFS